MRTMASVGPGLGSGLSVAVNPGCADVLTSARMGLLYTTGSFPPILSRGNGCTSETSIYNQSVSPKDFNVLGEENKGTLLGSRGLH
jgi:hypothetical protein